MAHTQIPARPSVAGAALTVWLSPAQLAWLQQQGDPEAAAAAIIGKAHAKATTPREPFTRVWRNPDYATAPTPAITPRPSHPPSRQRPQPKPTAPTAIADPADAANRLILQSGLQPSWSYHRPDADWRCTLMLGDQQYTGSGPSKRTAKRSCCEKLLEAREQCA